MAEALPKLSPDFRDFLIEAKQHGYGSDIKTMPPTLEGEHGALYESGPYRYIDRWVGGNLYGGFEHVSAEIDGAHVPIWSMQYIETYLHGMDEYELRQIIGKVLAQPDPNLPLRGPKSWQEADTKYFYRPVSRDSNLESFDVEEFIHQGTRRVYVARFMGGLVNRDNLETVPDKFWLESEGK